MSQSTPLDGGRGFCSRDPEHVNAYLVGGGIASLAAACCLIHEAHVPAAQIHILESSKVSGGAMDGSGNPDTGYIICGGRMLNFTYRCLYDLLSTIPSLSDPKVTVMDEINMFNAVAGNKTHANARLVTRQAEYPDVRLGLADAREFELSAKDRVDLLKMAAKCEATLDKKRIQDFFGEGFFQTNFWFMWATM
jgi:oleate hydratase